MKGKSLRVLHMRVLCILMCDPCSKVVVGKHVTQRASFGARAIAVKRVLPVKLVRRWLDASWGERSMSGAEFKSDNLKQTKYWHFGRATLKYYIMKFE